jgi:hypothetical protein
MKYFLANSFFLIPNLLEKKFEKISSRFNTVFFVFSLFWAVFFLKKEMCCQLMQTISWDAC